MQATWIHSFLQRRTYDLCFTGTKKYMSPQATQNPHWSVWPQSPSSFLYLKPFLTSTASEPEKWPTKEGGTRLPQSLAHGWEQRSGNSSWKMEGCDRWRGPFLSHHKPTLLSPFSLVVKSALLRASPATLNPGGHLIFFSESVAIPHPVVWLYDTSSLLLFASFTHLPSPTNHAPPVPSSRWADFTLRIPQRFQVRHPRCCRQEAGWRWWGMSQARPALSTPPNQSNSLHLWVDIGLCLKKRLKVSGDHRSRSLIITVNTPLTQLFL